MSEIEKDLEDKIGTEKVEEILEKEWKVAELPTEEELLKNASTHPKARNNLNSRKNLAQYKKREREAKQAALDNFKYTEVEPDIVPQDIFAGEISDDIINIFEVIMRPKEAFKNRSEQEMFWATVKLCLKDFQVKDLSSSDFDDIASLAKNRVLEHRLLKAAGRQKSDIALMDVSTAIEKLQKDTKEIKKSLSNRRIDRVETKNKPTLSIVDLAAHLDHQKKLDFQKRVSELEKEQAEYVPPLRDKEGNLIEG